MKCSLCGHRSSKRRFECGPWTIDESDPSHPVAVRQRRCPACGGVNLVSEDHRLRHKPDEVTLRPY